MLFLLSTTVLSGFSQSLLKPENDSTFTAEYRNGDEWAMIAKEGFIVGVSNKLIKDDYGKFYRLQIMIQNLSNNSAQVRKSVDSPPGMLTEDHHHTVHEERQVCYSSHLRPKSLHL